MALDLGKIKGISDDIKRKLAQAKNADELNDIVKAANLTDEYDICWTGSCII